MLASDLMLFIYENDKVEFILNEIGCHHITSSLKEYRCGLPNHKNKTAVSIKKSESLKSKIYSSDSSVVFGNLITIVMHIKDIEFIKSLKYLHEILGLEFTKKVKDASIVKKQSPMDIFNSVKIKPLNSLTIKDVISHEDSCLDEYIPHLHISWLREGILPFTAKEFGIGYDQKSRRIIIPHRSYLDGRIVGVIGRTTIENSDMFDIPKYFPLLSYAKSTNLYGMFENYKYIQEKGYCVVGESEKFVLKRHSRLDNTCVALCGHEMLDEHYKLLIGLDVDIIISMDKGIKEEHIWSMCNKFYGVRNVYYTYDKYDILQDKDSISDSPNKIYNWFINNKIKFDNAKREEYLIWESGNLKKR